MSDMQRLDRRGFLLAASGLALGANMQNRSYELETVAAGKSLKAPTGRAVLTYLTSKPEGFEPAREQRLLFPSGHHAVG